MPCVTLVAAAVVAPPALESWVRPRGPARGYRRRRPATSPTPGAAPARVHLGDRAGARRQVGRQAGRRAGGRAGGRAGRQEGRKAGRQAGGQGGCYLRLGPTCPSLCLHAIAATHNAVGGHSDKGAGCAPFTAFSKSFPISDDCDSRRRQCPRSGTAVGEPSETEAERTGSRLELARVGERFSLELSLGFYE